MWLLSGNGNVPCSNPEKHADYPEIYFTALQNFAFGMLLGLLLCMTTKIPINILRSYGLSEVEP
jgi:hypothetical protein